MVVAYGLDPAWLSSQRNDDALSLRTRPATRPLLSVAGGLALAADHPYWRCFARRWHRSWRMEAGSLVVAVGCVFADLCRLPCHLAGELGYASLGFAPLQDPR